MQLKAVSMAILGVGATLAMLNMAFHPLARMGALTHDDRDLRAHTVRNRKQGTLPQATEGWSSQSSRPRRHGSSTFREDRIFC